MTTDLAKCSSTSKGSRIVVEDSGRSATFVNPGKKKFTSVRVDGCVIKNATASDFLVLCDKKELFVELKGCNLKRALEQLIATMTHWDTQGFSPAGVKRAALAVCSRVPQTDGSILRLKNQIAKRYGIPLKIKSGNNEYDFDSLFTHRG